MIIIADSHRPHKRILQKGEWRDGGGGRGAAQTALRAVSAAEGRSGGSAAGGCAPISAPFAYPPGGPACRAGVKPQTGKKSRAGKGQPFPPREPGREPGHRAAGPAAPSAPPTQAEPACPGCAGTACGPPSPVSLSLRTIQPPTAITSSTPPPHIPPPATIKFSPTRRPHPAKSLRAPAKKRRPHRDGALLTFFGFSPAWQGRHGCGRGSPHGPAPPPALCRRRG